MKKIPFLEHPNKYLAFFAEEANHHIEAINQIIEHYNSLESSEVNPQEKIDVLNNILKNLQVLDALFSHSVVNEFPQYRDEIHHKAFDAIQEEFRKLGLNPFTRHDSPESSSCFRQEEATKKLSEMISNFSYEKACQFATTLVNEKKIANPYIPSEQPYYDNFLDFQENHCLEALPSHNCLLFKLTHLASQASCILKIENRMGVSPQGETMLRQSDYNNIAAPVFCEKKAYVETDHPKINKTLSLTVMAHINGGNLLDRSLNNKTIFDTYISAIHYFKQLLKNIESIEALDLSLIDLKLTNLLIDFEDRMYLADLKSLIPTKENMMTCLSEGLRRCNPKAQWLHQKIIYSMETVAPELHLLLAGHQTGVVRTGPMHVFMFGMTLFHYLTQGRYIGALNDDPQTPNHLKILKYLEDPVFEESPIGKKFKNLIEHCICNIEERVTTQEIGKELDSLEQLIHDTLNEEFDNELSFIALEYPSFFEEHSLLLLADEFNKSHDFVQKQTFIDQLTLYKNLLNYKDLIQSGSPFICSELNALDALISRTESGECVEVLFDELEALRDLYHKKNKLWSLLNTLFEKLSAPEDELLKLELAPYLRGSMNDVYKHSELVELKMLLSLARTIDRSIDDYKQEDDITKKDALARSVIYAAFDFNSQKGQITQKTSAPSPLQSLSLFLPKSRWSDSTYEFEKLGERSRSFFTPFE